MITIRKAPLLILLSLLILSTSFKTATEINWVGFNEGYTLAKKKKKIMLIDMYTDWCGWCKRMDRDAYGKSEIIDLVTKDFIAIKFNPELKGEYTFEGKSYSGRELAGVISEYKLNGYPTTVFVHPKTSQKKIIVGYRNADLLHKASLPAKNNTTFPTITGYGIGSIIRSGSLLQVRYAIQTWRVR
jgi:thioredoxin-related protein